MYKLIVEVVDIVLLRYLSLVFTLKVVKTDREPCENNFLLFLCIYHEIEIEKGYTAQSTLFFRLNYRFHVMHASFKLHYAVKIAMLFLIQHTAPLLHTLVVPPQQSFLRLPSPHFLHPHRLASLQLALSLI